MSSVTQPQSSSSAANEGALAGLKVLDLSRVLAGPWCGQLLGDLGAEVIKVESPMGGDDTRAWGPPFLEGESAYFLGCNRNKKGIAIDFSGEHGKELLAKLIPQFDVLIENFKNGTLDKWGFDRSWFDNHAPKIVHCSITGYGSDGPQSDLPGYDFILQAESGLMSIAGPVDGEPTKYGVAIVDLATGMMAANAIQAALLARYRTGKGQFVEVSLFDTSIALLANVGNSHLATGKAAGRYGNGHPTIVPYTTYHCADGMVALAVGNDKQFAKLSQLLSHPEWSEDARLITNAARVQNRDLIDKLLQEVLQSYSSVEIISKCRANGIPIGRVNTVSQALAQEQVDARQMILKLNHSKIGQFKSLASPLKLHGTKNAIENPPPQLGEHTDIILKQYLGLSVNELDFLREKKVIL